MLGEAALPTFTAPGGRHRSSSGGLVPGVSTSWSTASCRILQVTCRDIEGLWGLTERERGGGRGERGRGGGGGSSAFPKCQTLLDQISWSWMPGNPFKERCFADGLAEYGEIYHPCASELRPSPQSCKDQHHFWINYKRKVVRIRRRQKKLAKGTQKT